MNTELLKILIQRGVIRENTTIEAMHFARGLSCTNNSEVKDEFRIIRAIKRGDEIVFLAHTGDNIAKEIHASKVQTVDGMDEQRVAKAYMLNVDGDKIPEGRRRGRKPKGWVEPETDRTRRKKAEEIIRLYEFGWSEADVAIKLGITGDEVDRILEILDPSEDDFYDEDEEEDLEEAV